MKQSFVLHVVGCLFAAACAMAQAQTDWPQLKLTQVGSGAFLPVQVSQPRDGTGRFFVAEQGGKIQVYQSGSVEPEVFLDISDRVDFFFGGEDGLLSIAFPPDFATKKYFYVFYTSVNDRQEVLSRFFVTSTNENRAEAATEQQVLVLERSFFTSVNSGQLSFGPDGYLYVGVGDLGFNISNINASQNPLSLFGKILRIDTETSLAAYQIPPTNPFRNRPDFLPEIWAIGVRNLYRFSFDRLNGDLYMADVGQLTWEELNWQPGASPGGENYGWPIREGKHPYRTTEKNVAGALMDPVLDFQHGDLGNAIVGGYVYRGPNSARMNGMYFFADFYSGEIQAARNLAGWQAEKVAATGHLISSFGEDEAGQLYVTDYISGEFFRIEDSGDAAPPVFSPPGPTAESEVITVSSLSTGAAIHYTTDGSDPELTDPFVLEGGTITTTDGATLKARAFRPGLAPSAISSATYVLKAAAPTFDPPQGPASPGTPITMQSRTPGSTIRYTLDGSDPSPGSTVYVMPVPFNPATPLKARSFKAGFADSSVASFATSPFQFQVIEKVSDTGDSAVRWHSETGKMYQLQFTDDFSGWLDLGSPIAGTGAQISVTNIQVFPVRTMRHFRLEVSQP